MKILEWIQYFGPLELAYLPIKKYKLLILFQTNPPQYEVFNIFIKTLSNTPKHKYTTFRSQIKGSKRRILVCLYICECFNKYIKKRITWFFSKSSDQPPKL